MYWGKFQTGHCDSSVSGAGTGTGGQTGQKPVGCLLKGLLKGRDLQMRSKGVWSWGCQRYTGEARLDSKSLSFVLRVSDEQNTIYLWIPKGWLLTGTNKKYPCRSGSIDHWVQKTAKEKDRLACGLVYENTFSHHLENVTLPSLPHIYTVPQNDKFNYTEFKTLENTRQKKNKRKYYILNFGTGKVKRITVHIT